jgi:hypothetical protein
LPIRILNSNYQDKKMSELNELQLQRRQKLDQLFQLGINPYPAELWDINAYSQEILNGFNAEENNLYTIGHKSGKHGKYKYLI